MRQQHIQDVPKGAVIGGFIVDAPLGSGGCGAVYRAALEGAVVALKLQSLRQLAGWAEREVVILLRLKHRNVVGFQACGRYPARAPDWFYLAMEYVPGRTLHRWVEEENPSARRVAELLLGMARGLAATHAAGVLHRDIKEVNVVVREPEGEPVLVDFGVGDYVGAPRLTHGVLPPGTPRYRSPEALAFRRECRDVLARYEAQGADDLYALGVVFYWMLTARYPFHGAGTLTEIDAVITQVPPAPHEVNPRVPLALSALCMRLLAKVPTERGSAQAVCASAEALLAGVDGAWDVPLCDVHPAEPDAPEQWSEDEDADDVAAMQRWLRDGSGDAGPPRRGKRPGREGVVPVCAAPPPGAPVLALPAASAARPVMGGPAGAVLPEAEGRVAPLPVESRLVLAQPLSRTPRRRGLFLAAVLMSIGVGLVVGVLWVLPWTAALRTAAPERDAGWEMAPFRTPPESARTATPLEQMVTPAVVTSTVTHPQKEELPVKKTRVTDSTQGRPPAQPGTRKAVAKTLTAAVACAGLACTSRPQVRPTPPAEECPPGAAAAMKKLGIEEFETGAVFLGDELYARVREGWVEFRVGPDLGGLENGKVRGRLIFSDRIYGRFTEGVTKQGTPFPVCLELIELKSSRQRGIPSLDGDSGQDSVRIYTNADLRSVDRFE